MTAETEAVPVTVTDLDGEQPGVLSGDAVRMTGVTFRQLDHWSRLGYLKPRQHGRGGGGSGCPRYWLPEELRVARTMGRLIGAGLSLEMAATVARNGWSRSQIGPGVWLELGLAVSEHCDRDDHGRCFPDEPSACGCQCHEEART